MCHTEPFLVVGFFFSSSYRAGVAHYRLQRAFVVCLKNLWDPAGLELFPSRLAHETYPSTEFDANNEGNVEDVIKSVHVGGGD